jgi:formylglycine-generating enzyme required for sulfatase activity
MKRPERKWRALFVIFTLNGVISVQARQAATLRDCGRDQWVSTSSVGSCPPNAFALYDMNGNVLEWVQDCFAPDYSNLPVDGSAYKKDLQLKTSGDFAYMIGTSACSYHRLRAGDWGDPPRMIRSATRNWAPPRGWTLENYRSGGIGFRVAKTLE